MCLGRFANAGDRERRSFGWGQWVQLKDPEGAEVGSLAPPPHDALLGRVFGGDTCMNTDP